MNPNIQVVLKGDDTDFTDEIQLNSVSFNYGYNMIPYVIVDLTPFDSTTSGKSQLNFLCNIEKYRRKKVTVKVKSSLGCLNFNGLIDGLSESQSFGSIHLQLIIKSRFQTLLETYPRVPGIHPTSIGLFKRRDILKISADNDRYFTAYNFNDVVSRLDDNIDTNKNLIDFIIDIMKIALKNQSAMSFFTTASASNEGWKIVELADKIRLETMAVALEQIDKIDTTATKGMKFTAGSGRYHELVQKLILENPGGNLYEMLLFFLQEFGCSLIIGNDKAFIVPDVGFIKKPHAGTIPLKGVSKEINSWYPSQYTQFNFNDSGYKDIRACYVLSDESATFQLKTNTPELGAYIDNNSKGGIIVVNLPTALALGASGLYYSQHSETHKNINSQTSVFTDKVNSNNVATDIKKIHDEEIAEMDAIKLFVNNWAQIKYLQSKYSDRTGGFVGIFNPNVCPGVIGTLYSRHPGTYVDFLVNSVTHTFRMTPPNEGVAETSITFSCGRLGSSLTQAGIDKVELFDYTYSEANNVASAYVKDITGK